MRNSLIWFGLAVTVALAGCSSADPKVIAPADNSSTTTTTTSQTTTTTKPVDPAVEAVKDKAFAYYTSPERRQRIDSFFATEGMRYAKLLLQPGGIPSLTRGWAKGVDSRPPTVGYGVLYSDNLGNENRPYLGLIVHFRGGKVNLSEPIQGIFIIKGNRTLNLEGKLTPRVDGTTMSDNPDAYCWRIDGPKPIDGEGFTVSKRDGGLPNPDFPLNPSEKYEVKTRADFRHVTTDADIRAGDDKFFAQLSTEFAVNPADWR